MHGQTPAASAKPAAEIATQLPAFEVATIKPVDPNARGMAGFYSKSGGRVYVGYANVQMLIREAFDVNDYQVSGLPDWDAKDRYNVEAVPPDTAASRMIKASSFIANPSDEQRKMLQSLLVDRFGLKFHREIKEGSVFLLVKESGKLQMQDSKNKDKDTRFAVMDKGGVYDGEAFGTNISMPYLAKRLSGYLHRPVLDQTGLKGTYDFHVDPYDSANTDFISSVIESLKRIGLKLKAGKGPVETIVIDSVTRPTAN